VRYRVPMLAFALIVLAAPDLTLTWSSGEHSRDASHQTSTWTLKDNLLTNRVDSSGRYPEPDREPKKPVQLDAGQQQKVSELLAACDKLGKYANDKAHEGRFTEIELVYGPKKRTVRLQYDYDPSDEVHARPDSPARAKAFAAVIALQTYFYQLMPAF
jgi:hypothetical protein